MWFNRRFFVHKQFFFDDGYSTVIINTRGFYIKNRDSGWTDFLIQNDHFK